MGDVVDNYFLYNAGGIRGTIWYANHTKVATKNIANIIAATKKGLLNIFCNAIDIIITAIGKAKNISNKVFIIFLLFSFYYILCLY